MTSARFTSRLADVYFEVVLKGSEAELWVSGVRFSLCFLPLTTGTPKEGWALETIADQTSGGLTTAAATRNSDNTLRGLPARLADILSLLTPVELFNLKSPVTFG